MARTARRRAKPSRKRSRRVRAASNTRKRRTAKAPGSGAARKPARRTARKSGPTRRPSRSSRVAAQRRIEGRAARQAKTEPREDITPELDFGPGDERGGRAGDLRPRSEIRDEFPPSRAREAGKTGGEADERDRITADDASPETLLDSERLEGMSTPVEDRARSAADTGLSVVDASAIGAGGGTDEAEDARRDPVPKDELKRIRARVARSGGDATNLEPAESAAGSPGRERNTRRKR